MPGGVGVRPENQTTPKVLTPSEMSSDKSKRRNDYYGNESCSVINEIVQLKVLHRKVPLRIGRLVGYRDGWKTTTSTHPQRQTKLFPSSHQTSDAAKRRSQNSCPLSHSEISRLVQQRAKARKNKQFRNI
eukprot:43260-Amorphochlora_amoeboformis.AAC.1